MAVADSGFEAESGTPPSVAHGTMGQKMEERRKLNAASPILSNFPRVQTSEEHNMYVCGKVSDSGLEE